MRASEQAETPSWSALGCSANVQSNGVRLNYSVGERTLEIGAVGAELPTVTVTRAVAPE